MNKEKEITILDCIIIDDTVYIVVCEGDKILVKDGDTTTPLCEWLDDHDVENARRCTETAPDGRPLWMDQEEYDEIMERSIEEYEVMDGRVTGYPDIRAYAPYGYED